MRFTVLFVSFLIWPMCAVPAAAKGLTRKVVVSGPALSSPTVLTTPAALANVWSGDFLGGASEQPNEDWPHYLVEFYVEPPHEPMQMMYSVMYVHDPKTGRGFVYLPGRGESGWRRNVATIMRDGQDGRWHRASADWNHAIARGLRLTD
jgi:hypothetical protein